MQKIIKKHHKAIMYIGISLLVIFLILAVSTRVYVSKNSSYSNKNQVALYLYKYNELPINYITKNQVVNPGIQPDDGLYIGGDIHEYCGEIVKYTVNVSLRECDLSYNTNTTARGTNRLVYTTDYSEIFYTSDHYQSFTKITRWSINGFSNVSWILFIVIFTSGNAVSIYLYDKKKDNFPEYISNLQEVSQSIGMVMFIIIVTPIYIIINLTNYIIRIGKGIITKSSI